MSLCARARVRVALAVLVGACYSVHLCARPSLRACARARTALPITACARARVYPSLYVCVTPGARLTPGAHLTCAHRRVRLSVRPNPGWQRSTPCPAPVLGSPRQVWQRAWERRRSWAIPAAEWHLPDKDESAGRAGRSRRPVAASPARALASPSRARCRLPSWQEKELEEPAWLLLPGTPKEGWKFAVDAFMGEEGGRGGWGEGTRTQLGTALLSERGAWGAPGVAAWGYEVPGGIWGVVVTLPPPPPGRGRQGIRALLPFFAPKKKKRSNFLKGVSVWTNAAVDRFERDCFGDGFLRRSFNFGVSWSSTAPRLVPGRGENKWRNTQGKGEAVAGRERGKQQ